MQTDFLQILPRELAQTQRRFFREALRRSQLAGRSIPNENDWPPNTPESLIQLFEDWKNKHNHQSNNNKHGSSNQSHHHQDRMNEVAWDPW